MLMLYFVTSYKSCLYRLISKSHNFQVDSASLAKERNEAVNQLGKELKELERLEAERRELFVRIDTLERERTEKVDKNDMSRNLGDLNMKLKLEMGNARSENEKLLKANEQLTK